MEALNRQETEDLIVDLYFNQKKTFREIQRIVRKSPRDISTVLNKIEPERSSLSISSQAYKLFSEGKTPIQVAITLNLREPDARQFFLEYWNLQHLYSLYRIYQEIKANIGYFVNLYKLAVAAGYNVQHVAKLLNIVNNDLPAIEYRYQLLKKEAASLIAGNRNAARTFQDLSNQITELNQYHKQLKREIDKISKKKIGLERYVEWFQKNNDVYLKIKETIKQEIGFTLTDPRQLLKLALVSLIESSRTDPKRFYALTYNKDLTTATLGAEATSINDCDSNGQSLHPDFCNSDESYEKILLDEGEKLYNKIIDNTTSKTITFAIDRIALSLQPEMRPSRTETRSSQKSSTFTYSKEEHTFIQAEISDESQIKKSQ